MIPSYDLRIGNWITINSKIALITTITDTTVAVDHKRKKIAIEDLHPIPLTNDVLVKAAFQQRGVSGLYDKLPDVGFSYYLHQHRVLIFHPGDNTLSHWLNTKIVYLHQLQNFFYCLIGYEVQITMQ